MKIIRNSGRHTSLVDSDKGQVALVDAIIFMIFMSLASGIILGSAGNLSNADNSGLQQYTSNFADTLLAVEIGENFKPVSEILCDEAILDNQLNFTDINAAILETGDALIRPGLGYAISCQDIFLSNYIEDKEELPAERQASQKTLMVLDSQIDITIYVWVI